MGQLSRTVRNVWSHPAFALSAVASVVIGIFAATTTFSLAEALLWRPLGVHDPERLVLIARADAQGRRLPVPLAVFESLSQVNLFEAGCGFHTPYTTIRMGGVVALRPTHAMTRGCFDALGIRPAVGRLFDDPSDGMRVAVLTYDAWQRAFNGSPDAIGSLVTINDNTFTIIGVTERRFSGLLLGFPPDLLFPIDQFEQEHGGTQTVWLTAFMRRRGDIDLAQVRARLEALWPRLLASAPLPLKGAQLDYYLNSRLLVTSAETGIDFMMRERFGRPVAALLGLGVIVLLGSLMNLAHLLLARLVDRHGEFAVRLALGASRGRLVVETGLEGLLLVAMGSLLGVAVAVALNEALVSLFAALYPGFALEMTPRGSVWWLVFSIAAGTQAVFALVPALCVRGIDLSAVASATSRIVSQRSTARRLLVAAQVALSLVLLTVGGLTIDSLLRIRGTPLGWEVDRVLTAHLAPLPGVVNREAATTPYYHELLDELEALPGVESAATSRHSPLFFQPYTEPVYVHGQQQDAVLAEQHIVSEKFFETLGIRLLSGRIFTRGEDASAPDVAIISQSLARRLFGTRSPLGHHLRVGVRAETASLEIVGVVADAILLEPRKKNTATVYRSFWQVPPSLQRSSELLVRTLGSPASAAEAVRDAINRGGQEFPHFLRTASEHRDIALADERLVAWLGSVFAGVGLAVAALGIFGLLSHLVSSRRREVGLRMALGANPVSIVRMILREALVMTGVGLVVGVPMGGAIGRAAGGALGDGSSSPVTFVMMSVSIVLAAGMLAAIIPARRAVACDPGTVLREA